MGFDAGEDGGKEDRNEGEEGRQRSKLGKGIKGAWEGADPGEDGPNGGEADSADSTIGHGVEIFGTGKNVQALGEVSRISIYRSVGDPTWMKVLLRMNMTAVAYQTHLQP